MRRQQQYISQRHNPAVGTHSASDCSADFRVFKRRAFHAGSWYPEDPSVLGAELTDYLEGVDVSRVCARANLGERDQAANRRVVKALVSPHAGYRYSGPTAAWGFSCIDRSVVRRIFILGPSHHVHLEHCALPNAAVTVYDTPFGPIELDMGILNDLRRTGAFAEFSVRQDEEEHSVEMQLPFAKYMMGDQTFTIVPIVVGSTSPAMEARYGQILEPYFELPDTLFIISSDFCHWGQRFGYTGLLEEPPVVTASLPPVSYPAARFPINAAIEALDRMGMDYITAHDVRAFQSYLVEHQNTICGKHPICIFLEILRRCRVKCDTRFVHYSQSQALTPQLGPSQSCVSYASGVCCACVRA
mmetsp:Transcript_29805/g.47578  ORF Transcript_29805/g.47578 Transcript_29805/m.47578 type:complete len:358 (+) Transcript_29805:38-1111(+)